MIEDAELLRRYLADHSEEAFAELVKRHLNLIYFTALRRVDGRVQLAEDVTQTVFTALARNGTRLRGRATLAGWLYLSAKHAAANALRSEKRRTLREQEAQAMQEISDQPGDANEWAALRPVIDHAMDRLNDRDREAVILRFFEGEPYARIGAVLRVSEDAARVRVDRALDKLRTILSRQGYVSTSAALGAALAGQASLAAPAGLAAAITGVSVAAGSAGAGAGLAGTIGLWTFMSTTKMAVGVVAVVSAIGAGIVVREIASSNDGPAKAADASQPETTEDGDRPATRDGVSAFIAQPDSNAGRGLIAISRQMAKETETDAKEAGKWRISFQPAPSDPEEARLELRRRNGSMYDQTYRDLYLKLAWSPEEQVRFRELRLDANDFGSDLFRKAVRGDTVATTRDSARTVFEVVSDEQEVVFRRMVREAFGDAVLKEVINYDAVWQIQYLVMDASGSFATTNDPVRAATMAGIEQTLLAHSSTSDGTIDLAMVDVDAVLKEARPILNESQLGRLRGQVAQAKARAEQRAAVLQRAAE